MFQSFLAFLTAILRIRPTTATAGWLAIAVSSVAAFEGLRTNAYLDPVGIPTICFGETKGVKLGQSKTEAECQALLAERLQEFDQALQKCLPTLPTMPDETRAALVSWTYNVGPTAACTSTLVRRAKEGQWLKACDELSKWVYATKLGVRLKLPGLVKRRAEERAMCIRGVNSL